MGKIKPIPKKVKKMALGGPLDGGYIYPGINTGIPDQTLPTTQVVDQRVNYGPQNPGFRPMSVNQPQPNVQPVDVPKYSPTLPEYAPPSGSSSEQSRSMGSSTSGITLGTAPLISAADALVTNFVYNPRVKAMEAQQARNNMMPVMGANNFYGNDMGVYASGGFVPLGNAGNITPQLADNWENAMSWFRTNGMNYNDPALRHNASLGNNMLGSYNAANPNQQFPVNNVADFQAYALQRAANDPNSIRNTDPTGRGYSKVDAIPADQTFNTRLTKFEYNKQKLNPATGSYDTFASKDTGTTPLTKGKQDEFFASASPQTGYPYYDRTTSQLAGFSPDGNVDQGKYKFADGGVVADQFKVYPGQANVLAEGGEMMQLPNGSTGMITGDSHGDPSGGEYMALPEQTRIFSKRLKVDKDFATGLLNRKVNKKMPISKLADKFNTDKEDTILDDTRSDAIARRTAEMVKGIKSAKLDEVFAYQEAKKGPQDSQYMAKGGMVYADKGLIVPGDEKYIKKWNREHPAPKKKAFEEFHPTYRIPNVEGLPPLGLPPTQLNTLPAPGVNTLGPDRDRTKPAGPKPIGGTGLWDYLPEAFATVNAMSNYPIWSNRYQPRYLQPTEVNVQANLNANQSAALPSMMRSSGNASVDAARQGQTLANLYNANNQIMQYKYNTDNQNRQQVNQFNVQTENQGNLINMQNMDRFWDKMTQRKAVQDQSFQNIAESAYQKSKAKQQERMSEALINQMNPNWQFDPRYGFTPVQQGQWFHNPMGYQNGMFDPADGVKATETYKDPVTGKVTRLQENPKN